MPGVSLSCRRRACLVVMVLFVAASTRLAEACDPLDYACLIRELDAQTQTLGRDADALGKTVLPAISSAANDQQVKFESLQSDAQDFAADAATVLEQFKNSMDLIAREGLVLSQDLVYRMEDARRLVDFLLEHEREQYLAFTDGPDGCSPQCQSFRSELAAFIIDLQETSNLAYRTLSAQLAIEGQEPLSFIPQMDMSPLADLMEQVPGAALFPLHESLVVITESDGRLNPGCAGDEACDAISLLRGILASVQTSLVGLQAYQNGSGTSPACATGVPYCQYVFSCPSGGDGAIAIASALIVGGGVLGGMGSYMEWSHLDQNPLEDLQLGAAFGAEAKLRWEAKQGRAMGKMIKALSAPLMTLGSGLNRSVTSCRTRLNQSLVLCFMAERNPHKSTYQDCYDRVIEDRDAKGF